MPSSASPVRTVLITGAGSGLGRTTARALLTAGHQVVLTGRRVEALDETAAGHPDAIVLPADVSDPDQVRNLFAAAVERTGRIDVLFNNAGVFGPAAAVDELTDNDWAAALAVNLSGSVFCAREAARTMTAQRPAGGRIINNGSLSAHRPRPRSAAYTITKHAINGLTASLSLDLREVPIAVTQLDIGNAATDMTSGIGTAAAQADGTTVAEPTFDPAHVGELLVHLVELPLGVSVPTVTLMATAMPYAGRG